MEKISQFEHKMCEQKSGKANFFNFIQSGKLKYMLFFTAMQY
jgi:hypothetical protein